MSTTPSTPATPGGPGEAFRGALGRESTVRALRADLPLVLFFIDDLTNPVATTMIASFQDRLEAFARHGVGVQGVVRAPAGEVAEYVATHGLDVHLVSDERGDAARALGLDPARQAGTTIVLFELVARAAVVDDVAPYAQAEAALGVVATDGGGFQGADVAPGTGGRERP